MILTDDPRSQSAEKLTNYMSRDGNEVKNAAGRELDETELNHFHEKSERNGFTRHFVLAPDRDDLSEEELDKATRKSMNEWAADKDTLEYCYSVHDDGNDVHVAATASKDSGDLWIDTTKEDNELTRLRDDIAADHFSDHSLDIQRRKLREQSREHEIEQEQRERQMIEPDPEPEPEPERDQEDREYDQGELSFAAAAAGEAASSIDLIKTPWTIAKESRRKQREEQRRKQERERDRGGRR